MHGPFDLLGRNNSYFTYMLIQRDFNTAEGTLGIMYETVQISLARRKGVTGLQKE